MKRYFLFAFFAIVGIFTIITVGFSRLPTVAEQSQRFIFASPFDLSQVSALSQYRSCIGHDYRGPMVATGKFEASPRSLKHYVKVKPEFRGTVDAVPVFAPFDGQVSLVHDDFGAPGDQQIWLTPHTDTPEIPRQWQFIFFHIKLDPALGKGSTVAAGQKIGTANLRRGPDNATDNFDIAMKFTRPLHRPAIDSVFHHMTNEVLKEYEEFNIRPADLIISEEYRDRHACPFLPMGQGGQDPNTIYFPPEAGSNEYIFLQNFYK
ncbi:MAG: hypothetical protein AAB408_05140 [Patescibacteria group bacterium]